MKTVELQKQIHFSDKEMNWENVKPTMTICKAKQPKKGRKHSLLKLPAEIIKNGKKGPVSILHGKLSCCLHFNTSRWPSENQSEYAYVPVPLTALHVESKMS